MRVHLAGDLGHLHVAVEGQAGNDRVGRVLAQVGFEQRRVRGVEFVGVQVRQAVGRHDRIGGIAVDVGHVDFVIPAFREEAGDEGADLAGAEDEYLLHRRKLLVAPLWTGLAAGRGRECCFEGRDSDETASRRTSGFFCIAKIPGRINGMNAVPQTPEWSPSSWTSRPAQQQPSYKDPVALARAVDSLGRLPPIVVSWEVEALKRQIAEAQRGERFLLQGGDCAESFADCDSGQIARKLKILLQMSLVLLHGMKKPVIRVGRFAGQYAKPRSTDTETKDGVTLPCYRGDLVNRPGFTAAEREPDPELLLRGYERAALTLNFVRALIDGGFADLHHPEYWDLGFVQAFAARRSIPADRRRRSRTRSISSRR